MHELTDAQKQSQVDLTFHVSAKFPKRLPSTACCVTWEFLRGWWLAMRGRDQAAFIEPHKEAVVRIQDVSPAAQAHRLMLILDWWQRVELPYWFDLRYAAEARALRALPPATSWADLSDSYHRIRVLKEVERSQEGWYRVERQLLADGVKQVLRGRYGTHLNATTPEERDTPLAVLDSLCYAFVDEAACRLGWREQRLPGYQAVDAAVQVLEMTSTPHTGGFMPVACQYWHTVLGKYLPEQLFSSTPLAVIQETEHQIWTQRCALLQHLCRVNLHAHPPAV